MLRSKWVVDPSRWAFVLIVAISTAVLCSNASPQISTTNILLPPSPNLEHRVQLTKGCWTVRDDIYDTSSDDDLVDVFPVEPLTKAGTGVECIIVEPEDASCHRDFKIRVRQARKLGLRSLIFSRMNDPDDHHHQVDLRVDVRVAELVKLEILTTTKRVEVGEKEVLQVIGRDVDQNVFTSLSGLGLRWQIQSGAQFIELQSLSEAKIATDEESASDNSKQPALGLSTGRAVVSVKLASLEAQVELTVSRALYVCPGPLVSLLTGSSLEPTFCLNRLGCFTSKNEFQNRALNIHDAYDWAENARKYSTAGKYKIIVEDKNELSNRGVTQVVVGDLDDVTHHVALNSSRSLEAQSDGDCPFFRSRGAEWPPLSKLLPTKDSYRHNLGKYYLIKGRPYVFLGLAKVKEGGYVPPHLHEQMSFKLNDASFKQEPLLQATLVTPLVTGTFNAEVRFRNQLKKFILIVTNPVSTTPADAVLMTQNCKLDVQVAGGSGTYRSRYRMRTDPAVAISSSVQVQNWTTVSTKAAGADLREEGRLQVWDELDESNNADLSLSVGGIKHLKMHHPHYYVMEGATVTLEVRAVNEEKKEFHCCANVLGSWEEVPLLDGDDPELLRRVEDDSLVARPASACASARFIASRIGRTRVRFFAKEMMTSAVVTVIPRLRLEPDSAALVSGSSIAVRILGGPTPADVSVIGEASLSADFRQLQVKCPTDTKGDWEAKVTTVRSVSREASDVAMEAKFTLYCIIPDHCRVALVAADTWEPLRENFVAEDAEVRVVTSVFGKNEQNITLPSWGAVHLSADSLKLDGSKIAVLKELLNRDISLRADIPELKFKCEKQVSVRLPMQVLPFVAEKDDEIVSWIWSGCDAKFQLENGSGEFSARSESLDSTIGGSAKRAVTVREGSKTKKGSIDRVIFTDDNFYPRVEVPRLLMFHPVTTLTLKQSPEYIVQGANITLDLEPEAPGLSGSTMVRFDWSSYRVEHSSMEWTPADMFTLRSKLNAKTFELTALRTGNATLKYRLCSHCDPTRCIASEKHVVIEKYRSAVLFPGSKYSLSSCDDLGPLINCAVHPSAGNGLITIMSNGTLVAGCDEGHALVRCTRENAQMSNVYFHISVRFPTKIEWFPSSSSHWIAQRNASYQLHAALSMGESTCFVDYEGERTDTWDFSIESERRRVSRYSVRSSKSLASLTLQPDHGGVWKVGIVVRFGSLNATCSTKQGELRTERRFLAHVSPQLVSPSRLLLPSSAVYEIQTSPLVSKSGGSFTCSLAGCGCQDFVLLPNCVVQTVKEPSGGVCAISVQSVASVGSGEFGAFPGLVYHVVVAEARRVSTMSLVMERNYRLNVSFHDEFSRAFTAGWADVPEHATRLLQFFPSRTVTIESEFLKGNQVNCSSAGVLQSFKVSTASRRATGTLVAALYENNVLVAKALVDRLDRVCAKSFLGIFCLDDAEMLVISSVSLAVLVAFLQGYRNKELYVFIVIATLYFALF